MSRYDDIIRRQYIRHYERGNVNMDPRKMSPIIQGQMQLTYGEFVSSLPEGGKVLDLGCGVGFLLYWLTRQPGIVPVGVDNSPSQVEAIRKLLPGIQIFQEDGLEFLRRNPDAFEGIFCIDVLEHIPGFELCFEWLEAAREALKPGGFFFCRLPNAANITEGYLRYIDVTHYRNFTSKSIIQLLEAAGFVECRIVPLREPHLKGKIRLKIEEILHRFLFRLSCHGPENIFTPFICAAGYKK